MSQVEYHCPLDRSYGPEYGPCRQARGRLSAPDQTARHCRCIVTDVVVRDIGAKMQNGAAAEAPVCDQQAIILMQFGGGKRCVAKVRPKFIPANSQQFLDVRVAR